MTDLKPTINIKPDNFADRWLNPVAGDAEVDAGIESTDVW